MGKDMEWEKVKFLWDISQDWLESDMYEGEYYKIRQKKVNWGKIMEGLSVRLKS